MPQSALVVACCGIGDILRATPLVRVFAGLGFEVDLLLAPAYPHTVELFESAPEIRHLYCVPFRNDLSRNARKSVAGLARRVYDIAAMTSLSADIKTPLRRMFRARRVFRFQRYAINKMASILGWHGPLPLPIAMHSKRDFRLPSNTVAMHPGCKPTWRHKRWHGFPQLAAHLPSVVVIGTAADLDDTVWPSHVRIFELGLPDTAALLRQCALLVSNDSGMFHLGAALGTRCLGVFGPTNPAREAMTLPNVFTMTKGLPCEAECRKMYPDGRFSCEYDLECMRTLTPDEVLEKIRQIAPDVLDSATGSRSTRRSSQ